MRYIGILAALLLIPVAADGDVIGGSANIAFEVTISVAGTVPVAAGDLVLNDSFVLTGRGDAFARFFFPPAPDLYDKR
jgi:hypothetical protein